MDSEFESVQSRARWGTPWTAARAMREGIIWRLSLYKADVMGYAVDGDESNERGNRLEIESAQSRRDGVRRGRRREQ